MKAWRTLGKAAGLENQELLLQERDGAFVIRSGGRELMSSARHHSEQAMARLGLEGLQSRAPCTLIGGLGLGYTVRATLDASPARGRAVVAEISAAVIEWNQTLLGHLAGRPLDDPRVEVICADVAEVMRKSVGRFDCILMDVDNGPSALSAQQNLHLFEASGIALMKRALRPKGRAVIWAAGPDPGFLKRLVQAGFSAKVERSAMREGGKTAPHVLFVASL